MATAFAKNFSRFRRLQGVTQKWIAARLGVAPDTVSRWLHGKTSPDAAHMAALAKLLGVSVDDLLAPEAERPSKGARVPIVGAATGAGQGLAKARPDDEDGITERIEGLEGKAETVQWNFGDVRVTIRVERTEKKGGAG